MSEFRDLLNDKTPEQLLQLIKTQATMRKTNKHDVAMFQTKDYLNSIPIHGKMDSAIEQMKQKIEEYKTLGVKHSKETKDLWAKIKELDSRIEEHNTQKTGYSEGTDKLVDTLAQIVKEMTAADVKKLNTILQNGAPYSLVDGMETLVALLRNHTFATNVDVELYFQDFTKIVLKMQRLDAAALDIRIVQQHREHLALISHTFSDPTHADFKNNAPFAAYISWAQNFCEYAVKILLATEEQTAADVLNKKKEALEAEISLIKSIEDSYAKEGMVDFYLQQITDAEARVGNFYTKITETDKTQALQYQRELASFEKEFFDLYVSQAKDIETRYVSMVQN